VEVVPAGSNPKKRAELEKTSQKKFGARRRSEGGLIETAMEKEGMFLNQRERGRNVIVHKIPGAILDGESRSVGSLERSDGGGRSGKLEEVYWEGRSSRLSPNRIVSGGAGVPGTERKIQEFHGMKGGCSISSYDLVLWERNCPLEAFSKKHNLRRRCCQQNQSKGGLFCLEGVGGKNTKRKGFR